MNKMKELVEKIITFIKARKGYCIVAAALIVLLIVVVPRLNIETAKEHDDRKNQETKKRQELLAELEDSELEESDFLENASGDGVVSGESDNTQDSDVQNNVSGQGIVSADGSNGESDAAAGQVTQEQNQNTNSVTANQSTGSQTQTDSQNQSNNQNQSQSTSQNQAGSQNQSQSTSQNQANNQNQSQSTSQNQSNNQNQSQSTNQGQSSNQNQSQNTNQSQTSNQNQSQGNSSSGQEEEYIMVTVKIGCDSVLNNPELSTSATIPSDGVIIEAKTAIKKGETVFDALKAVCTDYGITYTSRGPDSSAYITSIGGLAEKECGKYSGWKYKVNGTVSGKSSGAHKLNHNDVVEWYYATSVTQ